MYSFCCLTEDGKFATNFAVLIYLLKNIVSEKSQSLSHLSKNEVYEYALGNLGNWGNIFLQTYAVTSLGEAVICINERKAIHPANIRINSKILWILEFMFVNFLNTLGCHY